MSKPAKNILFLMILVLLPGLSFSQGSELYRHRVDSVKAIVAAEANDTQMVDALNTLSMLAWRKGNYQESDEFSGRALTLANKLVFLKGKAIAFNNQGTVAWYRGNYPQALDHYLQSLKLMEQVGNKKGLSDANNNVGMVHYYLGNYEKTIEYYNRSLQIDEEIGAKAGVALSHNNIGGVYDEMGNESVASGKLQEAAELYKKALDSYQRSALASEEVNNKGNLALVYGNMGSVYNEMALLEEKAGRTASAREMYDRSVSSHIRSLKLREEAGDQFGIAGTYISMGQTNLNRKKYDDAIGYFTKGFELGRKLGAKERVKNACSGLAEAYEKKNDLENAFKYRMIFIQVKDSIYGDELAEQVAGMQTKYETEKKEQQILLLNKEQEIKSTRLGRQEAVIWSAGIILLIVVGSGLYVLNRFRVAKKQKRIIEGQKLQVERAYGQLHEKNKEIMDSIYYARRIQSALITPEKYIEKALRRNQ